MTVEELEPEEEQDEDDEKYICPVCGLIFDEELNGQPCDSCAKLVKEQEGR